MRFKQISTGSILETGNKDAIEMMQKSNAYEVVPEPSPPGSEPPQEPGTSSQEPPPSRNGKASKKKQE